MTDAVETQAAEPVQLSLGDVQSFVQIIDICSKRGAFEGSELEGVGTLRSKVVKFLEANVPAESTEAPAEDAPVQSEMDMEPATEDTSDS
jgi:hypothetical protein